MKFNPVMVKEYRLIGYDNKKNISRESGNELEGGEIGSGNGITSIFEIMPTENNRLSANSENQDIGLIELHYRLPDDTIQYKLEHACVNNYKDIKDLCNDLKFAAAVTEFGLLLRHSKYASSASWHNVEKIARESANSNDYLQNEFITLVDKASKIYYKKKKKKDEDN